MCVVWHPDEDYTFAKGTQDGSIIVADTRQEKPVSKSMVPHNRSVYRLQFSKARYLASYLQFLNLKYVKFHASNNIAFLVPTTVH